MFGALESITLAADETTAHTNATVEPLQQPQLQPPSRFGATRIILPPDAENSAIQIIEQQNDTNTNDYVVFISSCIRSEGVYYAELITLLRTLTSTSKVNIYIGSPGGSLYTGAMIANAIKICKANVTTIAIGVVASAAALIWSYGHRRHVANGAVIMFHMSSHGDLGNSRSIEIKAANIVRYVKEIAIDPLVEQGVLTPDEAETIIDRRHDLWLDAATINSRLEKFNG